MLDDRSFPSDDQPQKSPHEKGNQTFARVFANELAASEIYKDAPRFPTGAIIVREKLLNAEDPKPELVTVMVKREKGFNAKTGDWEYLVIEGGLEKIKQRETVGNCSKCHAQAEQTDFVFKTYLK
ncbi:MAG: cytochrome P460 family protein [Actinomycetota bacterium]